MNFAIAWIATAVVFGVLDFLWLSSAAPKIYRPLIGEMLADTARLGPAVAFYLIYVTGLVFFVVAPALERGTLMSAVLTGAALGFLAYATYDLTNHATLRVWDIRMTLIDMAWGTIASAIACGAAFWITQRVG